MTTRSQLVGHALADNGYMNGVGYPGPHNKYETYLGRGTEYCCGDAVTYWFATMGLRLPSMQAGCATGFAYVQAAYDYAHAHGLLISSWSAQPGDIALFDWNGDGHCDHTELVTSNGSGVLYTIGGDSGPSNVDGYTGQGGTHRHHWSAPANVGNRQIKGVINAARLVSFLATAYPVLALKSPLMGSGGLPKYDIVAVQNKLHALGYNLGPSGADGVYGQYSHDAALAFQKHHWPTLTSMWSGTVTSTVRQALGLPTAP